MVEQLIIDDRLAHRILSTPASTHAYSKGKRSAAPQLWKSFGNCDGRATPHARHSLPRLLRSNDACTGTGQTRSSLLATLLVLAILVILTIQAACSLRKKAEALLRRFERFRNVAMPRK